MRWARLAICQGWFRASRFERSTSLSAFFSFPAELGWVEGWSLIALSCLTSGISAAVGLGGGLVMLAALANLVPPAAIIPTHAVIQLGSNCGRLLMMYRHVVVQFIGAFMVGSLIGVIIGSTVYAALPVDFIRLVLALYVLQSVWLPIKGMSKLGRLGTVAGGAIASFLAMFIGATGPFVASVIRALALGKEETVATHSAVMTFQHGIRMAALGFLGFAFTPWLFWLALMIASGILGTWIGRNILRRMPIGHFQAGMKIVLTVLAISLLAQAIMALSSSS